MPYPILGLAMLLTATAPSLAQSQSPTTNPSAGISLLQQLNSESQSLFASIRPGLVHVELPPPKWLAQLSDAENPAAKWSGRLDAQMQAQLRAMQEAAESGHLPAIQASIASTQPAGPATNPSAAGDSHTTRTIIVPRADGGYEFITTGAQTGDTEIGGLLAPRALGVCIDDVGHVLIPVCIDEESLKNRTVAAVGADGKPTHATFVGSDRQTDLTVFKLDQPAGKPANLNGARPADGSLVMLLSANGEGGHLCVWTGGQQDRGMVITADGAIAGFVRFGQFLSADAMKPIAQQLIQYGKVHRAMLGVVVSQSEAPDGRHAVYIERVLENSAAAVAGLHEGDFILSMAGAAVTDVPSFAAAIALRDGSTEMQVLRNGQPVTVTANLHPE